MNEFLFFNKIFGNTDMSFFNFLGLGILMNLCQLKNLFYRFIKIFIRQINQINKSKMNINELPPELLVRIFSNIDDFSQKIRLEHVCKHWREQIVPVNWRATKTCPVSLNNIETLGLVLNRCGEWMEELWLEDMEIDENLVTQMARRMNSLKHLKLTNCQINEITSNSISNLFGQQLCSFILDETYYQPNMRGLIENEFSKLKHLKIVFKPKMIYPHDEDGPLPTKLPKNLKSFSLIKDDNLDAILFSLGRDCNNLKIFHLQTRSITRNMILAIGKIKSLVFLNLEADIKNTTFQEVICNELPNLKAINIGGGSCFDEEMISNISRGRPDLVHLNVYTKNPFQIPDSLNSLILRIWTRTTVNFDFDQFFSALLFDQPNKSIQHLDFYLHPFPTSSNFIEKLLGQFPDLKSLHCQMYDTDAELTSLFSSIKKHLGKGRKIAICLYNGYDYEHRKYILPDDLPRFNAGWRLNECNGKCENFVLKKIIKEAIAGGNKPSFLDELWME